MHILCYIRLIFTSALGNGDPHFTTLDGKTYTFNGWGEYKVFHQQLDTNFMLQARTAPINQSATQFVAFAFGVKTTGDYVEVRETVSALTMFYPAAHRFKHLVAILMPYLLMALI